ncbi:MAG: acyltransferase family protein [Hyphomonadaceae bacterium]
MVYRGEIDGLRAVAVLAVVLYHYGFPAISGGFVGVDVFFVISGFLITSIVHDEVKAGSFTFLTFYERRFRRLLPALFVMLAFTLAVAWFVMLPSDFNDLGRAGFFAALFSSNFFFNLEINYFFQEASQSPLIHTWSLAVEEQFYIVLPVIVVVLGRWRPRWLLPAIIVLAAGSLAWSAYAISFDPQVTFYLLPSRAWELLAGSLLALAPRPRRGSQLASIMGVAGLVMIFLACVLYTHATPFPGPTALLPVGGAVMILHASNAGGGMAGRLLAWKPIAFVGKVSYSWYLWHWPIIVIYHYLGFDPQPVAPRIALFALSFLAAVASWRFIEQPFRRPSGRTGRPRPLKPVAAGVLGSLTAAAAFAFIAVRDGIPERVTATVLDYDIARHDWPESSTFCNQRSVEQARSGDVCHAGVDDAAVKPTFAIIGDSHGDVLWPSLSRAAAAHGARGLVFTRNGCPPLAGLNRIRGDVDCEAFVKAALAYIASQPDIGQVVLIGRLAWYIEKPNDPSDAQQYLTFEGRQSSSQDENAAMLAKGFAATRALLGKRELVVLRPLPEPSLAPAKQLGLAYWLGAPGVSPLDAETHRRLLVRVDRVLAEAGVRVLDSEPVLCNRTTCDLVRMDRSIYADSNHVTTFGASLFDGLFDTVFTEAPPPQ